MVAVAVRGAAVAAVRVHVRVRLLHGVGGVLGPGIRVSQELALQVSNVSAYAEAEEKSRLQWSFIEDWKLNKFT